MHIRKKLFIVLFTIILANVSGQIPDRDKIIGSWYLLNPTLLEFSDTLVFRKDMTGNTFSIWNFKDNNTLTISSGTIRDNNPKAKCFSGVLHYKWTYINSDDESARLEVSMGNKTNLYSVSNLDNEKLKLIRLRLPHKP